MRSEVRKWRLWWVPVQGVLGGAMGARVVQNLVFVVAGLAVLLLLRAVHHRFSSRPRPPGLPGLHSPSRRSPLRL